MHTLMKRRTVAAITTLTLAISLTACGSDDSDQAADGGNFPTETTATSDSADSDTGTDGADQDSDTDGPQPTTAGDPDHHDVDHGDSGGDNGGDDQGGSDGSGDTGGSGARAEPGTGNRVDITTSGKLGNSTYRLFTTPSGNIKCSIHAELRCDIEESEIGTQSVILKGPNPPAFDQTNDAGPYRELELQGTSGQVIDYGDTAVWGSYECLSELEGMTCRNQMSKQGFFLSKESAETLDPLPLW